VSVDVIVVGAGPCGLTLACELLKRGVRVRIFDQLSHTTEQSRALGLQIRTLELFSSLGVLSQMQSAGLLVDKIRLYNCGKPVGKISCPILVLPQFNTEEILNAKLEELGGKVERPVVVSQIAGETASLIFADGRQENLSARWIVGCDGAHSTVRRSVGAPFQGTKFPENFALADVVASAPFSHEELHGFLGNGSAFALFPLPQKDQFRMVASLPLDFNEKALSSAYLQQIARERTGAPVLLKQLLWTSIFTIHQRVTPQFRYGSVFLCGDAAHIHSPIGGQGLNISVQDSFNLGWKLALVAQGKAPPELLDTYNRERRPIALKTLKGTRMGTFIMNSMPRRMIFFIPFKKKIARAISQIGYRYSKPRPWRDFFWRGPKPGSRSPKNFEDPRLTLLVFGDLHPNLPEDVFTIRHAALESPLAVLFSVRIPALYLIRPDNIIEFRIRYPTEEALRSCLRRACLLV